MKTNSIPRVTFKFMAALLASFITHSAFAEMQVIDVERGIFTRPDLKLEEGERLLVGRKESVENVPVIRAQQGVKFGVRFKVSGKSSTKQNVVTMLYLTPGIVDENGRRHDKYTVTKDLDANAGTHDMAFHITEAYEKVPGTWEFLIFDEDRLLLRDKFELEQ